jgi:hypothetical protein
MSLGNHFGGGKMESIVFGVILLFLLLSVPMMAQHIRQERVRVKPGEAGRVLNFDRVVEY